jgi:hypothetical protein
MAHQFAVFRICRDLDRITDNKSEELQRTELTTTLVRDTR